MFSKQNCNFKFLKTKHYVHSAYFTMISRQIDEEQTKHKLDWQELGWNGLVGAGMGALLPAGAITFGSILRFLCV